MEVNGDHHGRCCEVLPNYWYVGILVYVIQCESGFNLSVFFSLQFLAFDTEASHDILKVWDGRPENEMALKEVSGSLLPDGIHSTLNVVTIQFETDFYISKSGFAIDFSSKYFSFKPESFTVHRYSIK